MEISIYINLVCLCAVALCFIVLHHTEKRMSRHIKYIWDYLEYMTKVNSADITEKTMQQ